MKKKITEAFVSVVILLVIFFWVYFGFIDVFELIPIPIITPIVIIFICVPIIAIFYSGLELVNLKTTNTIIYVCLSIIFIAVLFLLIYLSRTYDSMLTDSL